MTHEDLLEQADEIDVSFFDTHPPDAEEPEGGLQVDVGNGDVRVTEWTLMPEPDDPDAFDDWEQRPYVSISASTSLEELLDPKAVHRGGYTGDEGWDLAEVVAMPKEQQQKAIIGAAISYLAYHGGDEEFVESVGD